MPAGLLFDNGFLTDIRTGAAGAVAADCLARRDDRRRSASSGRASRRATRCRACARSAASRASSPGASTGRASSGTARRCARRCGLEARGRALGPRTCAAQADILITATPSHEPIVRPSGCRPGQHVTAVGSDTPGKQELEAACLARADLVVVDRLSQCARFGELSHAIAAGLMRGGGRAGRNSARWSPAGSPAGRSDDQITICDLTGVGFQDTAIAALAWSATRADVGTSNGLRGSPEAGQSREMYDEWYRYGDSNPGPVAENHVS